MSKQLTRPSEAKLSIFVVFAAAIDVLKYSEDDLQQILKAILEAQTPAPPLAPVSAPATPAEPRKKLKACSPDVYCGKSQNNATTSINNVKISLLLLELQGLLKSLLPGLSSRTRSVFVASSTNRSETKKVLSRSRKTSLRRSSTKVLVIYKRLWTPPEERSKGTTSIS